MCKEGLEKGSEDEFPELADLQEMRGNESMFRLVCDNFMPCVTGKPVWKNNSGKRLVSTVATIADEAFCLVALEHGCDHWKDRCEWMKATGKEEKECDEACKAQKKAKAVGGNTADTHDCKENKCTSKAGKGRGPNEDGGWSKDGKKRFNELFRMVKAKREENGQSALEKSHLVHRAMVLGKRTGKATETETGGLSDEEEWAPLFGKVK